MRYPRHTSFGTHGAVRGGSAGEADVVACRDHAHRVRHGHISFGALFVQRFSTRVTQESVPINSDRALHGHTICAARREVLRITHACCKRMTPASPFCPWMAAFACCPVKLSRGSKSRFSSPSFCRVLASCCIDKNLLRLRQACWYSHSCWLTMLLLLTGARVLQTSFIPYDFGSAN